MEMYRSQIPKSHVIDIDYSDFLSRQRKKEFPPIRKIQRPFKDVDTILYEPDIISIGPYHHGSANAEANETMKYNCLGYVLELNKELRLANYVEAINGLEEQVRSCYADDIQMEKKEFVKMLLLDGCFLLNTLHGLDGIVPPILNSNINISVDGPKMRIDENNNECIIDLEFTQVDEDSSDGYSRSFAEILSRDLLLLENQIPFFVIRKIFELVKGESGTIELLLENVIRSMEETLVRYPKANREYDRPIEFHHLLHLCYMYLRPSQEETLSCPSHVTSSSPFHHFVQLSTNFFKKNNRNLSQHPTEQPLFHWRRATEYNKARIELKKRLYCDSDQHSLLDIRFCNGTLMTPCLTIDRETCSLFRNLVAFEKTCPQFGNYIIAYAIFWSQFITAPDDVALLVDEGIIRNHLHSDKDVSDFFKSLGDGIIFDFNGDYYLKPIYHMMEARYQIWRPRMREWLGSITSKIPSLSGQNKRVLPN